VLEDVSELKPYNCAKAALMGYYAAMMGKAGFASPEDPLTGSTGFLKMMCDSYDEERLIRKWDTLAIEKIYLKPYASCRHTHPEIEAAFSIRNLEGFDAEKISSIRITTYKGVLGKHDFNTVYGESSARMSIPYSLAVALVTGRAGIEEFTEKYIQDPLVQKLAKMAVIVGDDELSKLVPDQRVAIVYVEQTDGMSYTKRVDYPKGEPENPLSNDELYAKFSSMTKHAGLTEAKAKELFHMVMAGKIIDYYRL
jgi:2-methylcitrate dehydratase PrpD